MRVLITGLPGWLGNQLLKTIIEGNEFDNIRCLVYSESSQKIANTGYEIINGDIRDKQILEHATKNVDIVIHLCGIIHPRRIKELFDVNTIGTENLISASIKSGVKRIIFISSNSVEGVRRDQEIMTERDALNPYFAYGKSKYLAEQALMQASAKIETVILRPCWFYGLGQPARQTKFFKMIQKGDPIVFGNGKNLRSLSYIDNTIQAILLACRSEKAVGQVYWIADKEPYPTIKIYETIARILNVKNFKPRFVPGIVSECCMLADYFIQSVGMYQKEIHVAGEMNKNIACSIKKAQKELNYNPQVSLEEGMRRSIAWCQDNGMI